MPFEIKFPSVGESVVEGVVAKWLKRDGDMVKKDDALFEVETDKISQEIVSLAAGRLKILVPAGSRVAVGTLLGSIDEAAAGAPSSAPASAPAPASAAPSASAGVKASSEPPLSPSVRKIVAESKLDASTIEATGPKGRITKGDALKAAEAARPAAPAAVPSPAPQAAPSPAAPTASPVSVGNGARHATRTPMTMLRKRIAERLLSAVQNTAMLTTFNEIDMSAAKDLRARYKDVFEKTHGVKLGFMSFFVKACVRALQQFPLINGYIDGDDIVTHDYCDIGVAVGTDRGLIVPVLRDVQKLGFAQIEKAIGDFAERARSRKIQLEELSGGTFTLTNGGVYGSLLSTPLLNPPQSGILGMHKIEDRPIAVNGKVEIRPMMYVALSYDHRIVDGKEAVGFLVAVKEAVENPERLLLEI